MNFDKIIDSTTYLLILINPVSKIAIISMFPTNTEKSEKRFVILRSTIIALGILMLFAVTGHYILNSIFHVDLYSLKVVGGIVLFSMGYKALAKGVFFEIDDKNKLSDLSIVPLASPMIAGPATITAAISFAFDPAYGISITMISLTIALFCNLLLMLAAPLISELLKKFNFMGALIRITGLIAATIAVQMIFGGVTDWLKTAKSML